MRYLFLHSLRSIRNAPVQTVIVLVTIVLSAVLFSFAADMETYISTEEERSKSSAYGSASVVISSSDDGYVYGDEVEPLLGDGDSYAGYLFVPGAGDGWSALGAAVDFASITGIFDLYVTERAGAADGDAASAAVVTESFADGLGLAVGSRFSLDVAGMSGTFVVEAMSKAPLLGSFDFLISFEGAAGMIPSLSPSAAPEASSMPMCRVFVRLSDPEDGAGFVSAAREALGPGRTVSLAGNDVNDDFAGFIVGIITAALLLFAAVITGIMTYYSLDDVASRREDDTEALKRLGASPDMLFVSFAVEAFVYVLLGTAAGIGVSCLVTPLFSGYFNYVRTSVTVRGVAACVILEVFSYVLAMAIYSFRTGRREKVRRGSRASVAVSAVSAAVLIASVVVAECLPVAYKYIPVIFSCASVIVLIFSLTGLLARLAGRISSRLSARGKPPAPLAVGLRSCENVASLRNVVRIAAVMISVVIFLSYMAGYLLVREADMESVLSCDYYVLNASAAAETMEGIDGVSFSYCSIMNVVTEEGRSFCLVACEDPGFFSRETGEVSPEGVYMPEAVADLYGYGIGDEITLYSGEEGLEFVLEGYSSSDWYGYFDFSRAGSRFMAAMRTDAEGEELEAVRRELAAVGAVMETPSALFASLGSAKTYVSVMIAFIAEMCAIALIGTASFVASSYMRRRGDFRLFREIGMTKGDVAAEIACEAAFSLICVALLSAVFGTGLIYLLDVAMRSFGFTLI